MPLNSDSRAGSLRCPAIAGWADWALRWRAIRMDLN
jgi:hypothetical protein